MKVQNLIKGSACLLALLFAFAFTAPVQQLDTLTADFSHSKQAGNGECTVTFTNLSSGYTGANWDFGDGTSTDNTAGTVQHVYTEVGTYSVTLTVTNDAGQSSVVTKPVFIIDEDLNGF